MVPCVLRCVLSGVSRMLEVVPVWRLKGSGQLLRKFFQAKVPRRTENSYQAPKLQAVGRESPPSPLSLKKGDRKMHVVLAAGPAASFGTFSWTPRQEERNVWLL